jgi:beta-lactamase class A
MTDANGTRNNLDRGTDRGLDRGLDKTASNGASSSSYGPIERPSRPSLGTGATPPSRYVPPASASSSASTAKSSSTGSTAGSTRRSRRPSARQRISAAVQEGRRRLPNASANAVTGTPERSALEKARAERLKHKSEGSVGERLRPRSRKVTSLPLNESARSQSRLGTAASRIATKTIGKTASKTTAPNLSLVRRRNSRRKTPLPLLYIGRLAIIGLGVAVIGGTLLKMLPNNRGAAAIADSSLTTSAKSAVADFPIPLNQEIAPLKTALQELPNLYPNLTAKAFYIDVDTGNYVNLNGGDAMPAASTIKLPILLAFFEEIDAGRITPNQTIAILPEQIAKGSGEMQLASPGTQFTALEVATQMIVGSDNTATNMMIDLLGGPAVLNERFKGYGLQKTQIISALPDLQGTNTTSARDLVHTMLLISGDRLKLHSRDRILNILNRTHNKSLLADGLAEKEALTFNKTGDIESVLGDVALVDLANGKRYIVAALVQRPSNDGRAVELIHKISGRTYQEADGAVQPAVTPLGSPKAVPGATTAPKTAPGAAPSAAPGAANAAPVEPTAAGSAEPTAMEEEPYPSANP